MPPLFKRIAIVVGASLLWMKQALAGVFVIPILIYALGGGLILLVVGSAAVIIHSNDGGPFGKGPLPGPSKPPLPPRGSDNISIDVTTGAVTDLYDPPFGGNTPSGKTCLYDTKPTIVEIADSVEKPDKDTVNGIIYSTQKNQPYDPMVLRLLDLTNSPNPMDLNGTKFYVATYDQPKTVRASDSAVLMLAAIDKSLCKLKSAENNLEVQKLAMVQGTGLEFLGAPNPSFTFLKYPSNFYGEQSKIYKALKDGELKFLNQVSIPISIVDLGFNDIKTVAKMDHYVVDDISICQKEGCQPTDTPPEG